MTAIRPVYGLNRHPTLLVTRASRPLSTGTFDVVVYTVRWARFALMALKDRGDKIGEIAMDLLSIITEASSCLDSFNRRSGPPDVVIVTG